MLSHNFWHLRLNIGKNLTSELRDLSSLLILFKINFITILLLHLENKRKPRDLLLLYFSFVILSLNRTQGFKKNALIRFYYAIFRH